VANKLYKVIAGRVIAIENCIRSGNTEWKEKHEETLDKAIGFLPSGSGLDNGTTVNFEMCKTDRIVLDSSFHVLDENGFYDGWIEFVIILTPSLLNDFNISIVGKFSNRKNNIRKDCSDIKSYLAELFADTFNSEVNLS